MASDPPALTRVSQPSLVSTIPAGQTVVTMATATVTANNGQTVTIPVQGAVSYSSAALIGLCANKRYNNYVQF